MVLFLLTCENRRTRSLHNGDLHLQMDYVNLAVIASENSDGLQASLELCLSKGPQQA